MVKIILITHFLQPYRLSFYKKLSEAGDWDFTVYHGIHIAEDGKAKHRGETGFDNVGFREHKYRIFPFDLVISKGMFAAVKKAEPDILIIMAATGNITYRRINSWARRQGKA